MLIQLSLISDVFIVLFFMKSEYIENITSWCSSLHSNIIFLFLLQSLAVSKQLLRSMEKEKLHAVNSKECEVLKERWLSDECLNAIVSFFQRKSKL